MIFCASAIVLRSASALFVSLANENAKRAPWYARYPVCPPFPGSNPGAPASQSWFSQLFRIVVKCARVRAFAASLPRLAWSLGPKLKNEDPDLDVYLRRPF